MNDGGEDAQDRRPFRVDFSTKVVRLDDAQGIVYLRMIPDPRRYDQLERDGEEYYLDKYFDYLIRAKDLFEQCQQQATGLPVHYLSSSIKSAPEYAQSRKAALQSELEGQGYSPPGERAAPHTDLVGGLERRWLVFLSVDICGGTALRRTDPSSFERAYAIFLRELGTVVGQFNGSILKTTGDGFIAFIDHPSFTQQSDHAVDMGLTFLVMLQTSINPALQGAGLPALAIRVGADCGAADIRHIDVPTTGYSSPEIASDALNRAVKIEQSADENEFRIGRQLYELLHVQWLERAEEAPFESASVGIANYKAYRMM